MCSSPLDRHSKKGLHLFRVQQVVSPFLHSSGVKPAPILLTRVAEYSL